MHPTEIGKTAERAAFMRLKTGQLVKDLTSTGISSCSSREDILK